MKTSALHPVMALFVLLAGCDKKTASSSPSATNSAISVATAAAEPTMALWQQGDTASAVARFVQTDWGARPLFADSSTLNLSEAQFKALSGGERQARSGEMMAQLDALRKLGRAVAEAGREAAAKGDTARARKHFNALKQCGSALDSKDCLSIVQLVGQAFKKMAEAELAALAR